MADENLTNKSSFEILEIALQQQEELGMGEIRVSPQLARQVVNTVKKQTQQQSSNSTATAETTDSLAEFNEKIKDCTNCQLHKGRNKFVFGVGNPNADVMFVGEGPGRDEDLQGEPFVGRAGKLLDKILEAIGFDRTQIYIANVVKCRPPNNRDPQPDEMAECMPYLHKQIELINPRFICCLGRISAQALLGVTTPLGKLRERFHDFHGRKLMVTYHPAALLRFQQYKRPTWEDVQMLRKAYDEWRESPQ